MSTIKLLTLSILCLIITPLTGLSQDITGVIKTKVSYISFEEFKMNELLFDGTIKENLLGSKYKVNLQGKEANLTGEIYDQLSRFEVNLSYGGQSITGEIKRSPNRTRDQWDIDFMGKKLTGLISYNAMETEATYELTLGDDQLTGTVRKDLNAHLYNLQFGPSHITGKMILNLTSVKHTYELNTGELSNNEFLAFFFVEFMQLINYEIWNIEDFHNDDDDDGLFDDDD